uniref:Si:ch73-379j16.2 n=1 Tax=Hippocampus comes TaxID=109280 RepID=A0A3Q2Y1Y9_HIPCM
MEARVVFHFALLLLLVNRALTEIRYSIPEEVKDGTIVGNIAKDLGLDLSSLLDRRFRVVSESKEAFFEVNQHNGMLYVNKRIDRDDSCQGSGACLFELKVIVENPLEIHYVVIEITDVNDHSPVFTEKEQTFEIAEHTLPGKRFQLQAAQDPDAGTNSIRAYTLTSNGHFEVDVRQSDEDKIPFLVLKTSLDREQKAKHSLILTAVDGGKPPRSGTLNVSIIVLDINDNRPMFTQDIYEITITEKIQIGTSIFQTNGTDPDEGINGEIEYRLAKTLRKTVYSVFEVEKSTGVIRVKGKVDYEENDVYKLDIEASDRGTPPLTGECRVIIKIRDINDNAPQIEVTSLSNSVAEDSKPGSVISLISVKDKDSGVNGKVIATITNAVPFELKPSYKENIFSVVTKDYLDREEVSHYEITIKATDCGEPPLSAVISLNIQISDVNDNCPRFEQNPLEFYLAENNVAGNSVFYVSATDKDINGNAAISYHIVREERLNDIMSFLNINAENGQISALKSFDFETLKSFQFQVVATDGGSPPLSSNERLNDIMSFLNINAENGQISALKSFDFETLKSFQFHVVATDGGSPPLSSNVTVKVFILDQNDNAPVILYPVSSNGSAEGVEEIPRNLKPGDLVTKVRAYDIRTLRSFTETDEAEHRLLILVKDNGNISLSATATVTVKLVEPKEAFAASDIKSAAKVDEEDNVTFYLIITLGSVSLLFVISIIVLIAMQCSKSTEYTSKYLQDANYDGTLCHSIQYRSGDKRYMLVGPRRSIGPPVVPGSHANTLVLPDRRHTSGEVRQTFFFSFLLKAHTKHNSSCIQSARMVLPKGWRRFPSEPMTPISDIHSRQQRL